MSVLHCLGENPDQLKAVLSFKYALLIQILHSCSEQELMLFYLSVLSFFQIMLVLVSMEVKKKKNQPQNSIHFL